MRESDLYFPIRDWLLERGYLPKAEVKGIDIVACKDESMLAVELKNVLNLEVVLQAVDRQRICDIVYIGVPKKSKVLFTKRWKMLLHLLKRLEIGLLLVTIKGEACFVEEALQPIPFDLNRSRSYFLKKRQSIVKEYDTRQGNYNIGGVTKTKILTAYRENALKIAYLLSKNGSLSPKKLKELGSDSGKTNTILKMNHYGWFDRIQKGIYGLNEKGLEALKEYSFYVDLLNKVSLNDKNE